MSKLYVLSLLFIATFFKSNAQVCFEAPVEYPTGTNAYFVICADFNNDNDSDLVVANSMSGTISVFLGNGTGIFPATPNDYMVSNPMHLCSGDYNEDGFLDVVTTNGSEIRMMINDGAGGFTAGPASYYAVGGSSAVACGDINSDGNLDVVSSLYGAGTMALWLGNGDGTLSATPTTYAASANPSAITVAEVNGDTHPDVIVGNYTGNNISVLINNGSGGFLTRVNYSNGNPPGAIVAYDFDGDGDRDLAVSSMNTLQMRVFKNSGTGTFGTFNDYATSSNSGFAITLGDFNADTKTDIAVNASGFNKINIFFGDGAGTFGPYNEFPSGFTPRGICAGDFNEDGRSDLATADFAGNAMTVYLNNPVIPDVQASASDTSLCTGQMLTLIGTNTTGPATYTWQGMFGPAPQDNTPFSPPGTATYTVTGVTPGGCSDTDTLTVTVSMTPNIYGGVPSPVCAGQSVTFNQGSGDPGVVLSWSDGVQIGVPYFPAATHTYTLTGTSPAGCIATYTTNLTVTPAPTAVIAPFGAVCENDPLNLNSAGSVGGNNYQWTGPNPMQAAGSTPWLASTNVTVAGTYTLQLVNTTTGCGDTATVTVSFVPAPNVSANASLSLVCAGTPVIFTGSGANSYTWSGGASDGVPHVVNGTQTFTVTGIDLNGCDDNATVTVTVNIPPAPEICRITVDSLSQNNVIYWDKTLYPMADSFYVYRDLANNAYAIIGKVHHDSLSQFTDTLRTLYPANGDPNVSSWRYKIAVKDTCGAIGPMGLYHQSIFMQNNSGNFSWSEYKIEGQGTPVSGLNNYVFKRDNLSNGNYGVIQVLSASSTSYTDPNYATFLSTATWRTETTWSNTCQSTMRIGGFEQIFGAINTSRSNIKSPTSIGITEYRNELNVSIYPVPATASLTVELTTNEETTIEMTSTLGQKVYAVTTRQAKNTIDCTGMETGVYFITLTSARGQTIRKVIVQ